MVPSKHLKTTLSHNVPLALAIGTEKAKSEMIVTNVLVELREHFARRISLFSGDKPTTGFGQCVAEMFAAQRFNTERGNDIRSIYGVSTTGTVWQFLKLEANNLHIDSTVYAIGQCDKILGILASMVDQKA